MKTSEELFIASINQKYREIKMKYSELLYAIMASEMQTKIEKSSELSKIIDVLFMMISSDDRPPFLVTLKDYTVALSSHFQETDFVTRFISTITDLKHEIESFSWNIGDHVLTFDFDRIFEKYKKESKVNELFDNVINSLDQIIQSGEIDSVKVIQTLNRLLNAIKKNKDGSYFAVRGIWDFIINVLANYLWESLVAIPGLGPLLAALKTTLIDMNAELSTIHGKMKEDMGKEFQSDFPFITYDNKAKLIESTMIDGNVDRLA